MILFSARHLGKHAGMLDAIEAAVGKGNRVLVASSDRSTVDILRRRFPDALLGITGTAVEVVKRRPGSCP